MNGFNKVLKHIEGDYASATCGAIAYALVVGCTVQQAVKECRTVTAGKDRGTRAIDMVRAFKKRGLKVEHRTPGKNIMDYLDELCQISKDCPVCVSVFNSVPDDDGDYSHHMVVVHGDTTYNSSYPYSVYTADFAKCYATYTVENVFVDTSNQPSEVTGTRANG